MNSNRRNLKLKITDMEFPKNKQGATIRVIIILHLINLHRRQQQIIIIQADTRLPLKPNHKKHSINKLRLRAQALALDFLMKALSIACLNQLGPTFWP